MRRGLWVAAVLGLLLVFLAVRFPYRRLLPPVLAAASGATGAEIHVTDLGLGLGLAGPHVVARDVRLRWPAAPELELSAVRVRPAWSLAWLGGRAVWHVAAEGPAGAFDGVVADDRIDGAWHELDPDALPWILFGASAPVHGRLSGQIDLARGDGAWQGSARVLGGAGSVDVPGLPVAIPFVTLSAELGVAPDRITLAAARIEGPLVTANAAGSASPAAGGFSAWPLDLDVGIESVDPALRGYLGPLGIPIDGQGQAQVRVTGTLAAPYLAPSR